MAGKAAVGKVALYGREYLVAIQPRENGLVMYTLRHASEVRSMCAIDELKTVPAKMKPDEVKLARAGHRQLRDRRRPDAVQGRLPGRAAQDHRREDRGQGSRRRRPEEAPPKVVNLMEALRQSLERVSSAKEAHGAKSPRNPLRKAAVRAVGPEERRAAEGDTGPPAVLASVAWPPPPDRARRTDAPDRVAGNSAGVPSNCKQKRDLQSTAVRRCHRPFPRPQAEDRRGPAGRVPGAAGAEASARSIGTALSRATSRRRNC